MAQEGAVCSVSVYTRREGGVVRAGVERKRDMRGIKGVLGKARTALAVRVSTSLLTAFAASAEEPAATELEYSGEVYCYGAYKVGGADEVTLECGLVLRF